jgi:hypothetical protein
MTSPSSIKLKKMNVMHATSHISMAVKVVAEK